MRPRHPASSGRHARRGVVLGAAALACVAGFGAPGRAADGPGPAQLPAAAPASDLYIITLTANAQAAPRFPGSDSLGFFGYPSIGWRRAGEPALFEAPDDGVSLAFVETPTLRFGAVGRYQGGRYFADDQSKLFGLRDVKWSIEPGVFLEVWPVSWLRARAEVRYGLHGYEGVVGNLGLDWVERYGRFTFSLGPRLAFGDTSFTSAFFSVTPFEAALNGRVTPFRPRGGITSAGALGAITYAWSEQWATTVFAGYNRLVGDAGDSPITRRLGSENQFTVGASVSYSFALKPFW
jgi:MipA family protein